MYRNQDAAAYLSLYYFIFLSLKFFVTLFSGSVRPRRLKLGTHVSSGQMYLVYRNQAAPAYSSPYFFIFFLSSFQTTKFFFTLFSGTVRPRRLKLGAHMDNRWMYHVYSNRAAAVYLSLYFLYFSFQFSNMKMFLSHFSQELWGLEGWMLYVRGQWVDELCIPKVFLTFFSRTARHKKSKQNTVTNMKNKHNILCILKSGCSYFFILLFLSFSVSPIFSLY